jgi:hypothetical protein
MKTKWQASNFRAGEMVRVRSATEILATLDSEGCLDGMPFMPEMLAFCGRRMRVVASAHKTCDPAHKTGSRRLSMSVHLEQARCDGSAHGGCQAECNLFWNDAWLSSDGVDEVNSEQLGMREQVDTAKLQGQRADGSYMCQATELVRASTKLAPWDPRQYWLDITMRNHSVVVVLRALLLSWARLSLRIPIAYRLWSKLNDAVHLTLIGRSAPRIQGLVPVGQSTPTVDLSLHSGDRVKVRDADDIARTLDGNSKNRGMWFDSEQLEFCGREYAVRRKISKILDERTGMMVELKNPCVVLEGVYCGGQHSVGRVLCPRAITPYWRDIWLEKVK